MPRAGRKPSRARASRGGAPSAAPEGMVRLQRVMADAGVAARRVCEQLIEEGSVNVNGQVVRRLPVFVDPATDRITVKGRDLPRIRATKDGAPSLGPDAARRVYVMAHKPTRVLTAASDAEGRGTVLDMVKHPSNARLYPVGRLDYNATGLVLLTNDGDLANRLSHPRYGVDRVYEVAVKGRIDPLFLADLQRGLNLKAQRAAQEAGKRATGAITLEVAAHKEGDDRANPKTLLRITLKPGLAAKLEDMLGEAGVKATRITQIGLGPLKLIDCRPGQWRELERHEVTALKKAGPPSGAPSGPPPKPSSRRAPNNHPDG